MRIAKVIDELERAPRCGSEKDVPEGARYVVISETALRKVIQELRDGLSEIANRYGEKI